MPKIFNQIEETANQRLRVTQLYIKNEVMPFVKIELEKLGYILRPGDCKAAAVSLIIISW